MRESAAERTEAWFVHQGVPHFIVGYNAREDIFTRAFLLLAVVFLVELLNGISLEFDWYTNLAAAVLGIAVGVGAFVLVNHLRGRRLFQPPDDIGNVELAIFLLVPPLVPAAFGQYRQMLVVFALNVGVLVVVYLATSYALVPILGWALRQSAEQIRNIANLMIRSLPLLLLFTMFLFLNAEIWKVADDIPIRNLLAVIALVLAVGSAFVLLRVPDEVSSIATFASWAQVGDETIGTPVAGADLTTLTEPPAPGRLRVRERINVVFVLFFSQSVQILLVTGVIFGFYLVFGSLTVIDTTIVQWTDSEPEVWFVIGRGADAVAVTGQLVRTALLIAVVAGLQFTVSALTDERYRAEFYAAITARIRRAVAARAIYRCVLVPDRVACEEGAGRAREVADAD